MIFFSNFSDDLWKILNNYNDIILDKTIRVYISKLSDKVKYYIPPPQLERLKERINVNAWQKVLFQFIQEKI